MSHRNAKKKRKACRQQLMDGYPGTTNQDAKAEIADADAPEHNFTDLPDNRADRRTKRFKQRHHNADLKASSFLERRIWMQKWINIFTKGSK